MTSQFVYEIGFRPAARRQLKALPTGITARITEAIDGLAHDPRPTGATAMVGDGGRLRIRIGDYRVIYVVDDDARQVTVERVGHRRDIYR